MLAEKNNYFFLCTSEALTKIRERTITRNYLELLGKGHSQDRQVNPLAQASLMFFLGNLLKHKNCYIFKRKAVTVNYRDALYLFHI